MKRIILFAGLLVLLFVVFIFVRKGYDSGDGITFPVFSPEDVSYLNISAKDSRVELIRTNGEWYLKGTGKKADGEAVSNALQTLSELKTGDVISKKADKHAMFEVDIETGTAVEAGGESGAILNIIAGKNGPSFSSSYLRIAGDDKVYLVGGYIKPLFTKSAGTGWRETRIFDFEAATAREIIIESEAGTVSLVKNGEGGWQFLAPEEGMADPAKINAILNRMSSLRADGFADDTDYTEAGLNPASGRITVRCENGEHILLRGQELPPDKIYVRTPQNEEIYIKYKAQVDSLFMTKEQMASVQTPSTKPR